MLILGRVGLGHFSCGSGWVGSRKLNPRPTLLDDDDYYYYYYYYYYYHYFHYFHYFHYYYYYYNYYYLLPVIEQWQAAGLLEQLRTFVPALSLHLHTSQCC